MLILIAAQGAYHNCLKLLLEFTTACWYYVRKWTWILEFWTSDKGAVIDYEAGVVDEQNTS